MSLCFVARSIRCFRRIFLHFQISHPSPSHFHRIRTCRMRRSRVPIYRVPSTCVRDDSSVHSVPPELSHARNGGIDRISSSGPLPVQFFKIACQPLAGRNGQTDEFRDFLPREPFTPQQGNVMGPGDGRHSVHQNSSLSFFQFT